MGINIADLQTAASNYAEALLADSINPKPDYQIDGQNVSRVAWRKSMLDSIRDINILINQLQPYAIITKQVL